MSDFGAFHPQVVHFVVALGFVGIGFRLLSLLGRGAWLTPAAAVLIIISAGASVAAVRSGRDAHGPAERIPGARELVQEHEDLGVKTQNYLLVLAGLEVLCLLLAAKPIGKAVRIASAAAGLFVGFNIYHTSTHGGEIVYQRAGGVGTRSGNPADLENLLVAGLYHNARLARDSGRAEEAARLTEELALQRADDPAVQLLLAESKLLDRKDAEGALAVLRTAPVPPADARLVPRHGVLTAQALVAAGRPDSARALLTALLIRFPESQALKTAMSRLP